jgi:Na+-transporting methylmalonyl-CoA/oxaloacetate decarboxylase gamma subunit
VKKVRLCPIPVAILVVLLLFFVIAVALVAQNIVHEAVVDAAPAANHQAVRTANQAAVGKFTRALVIVAAAVAKRDETLPEIVSSRHDFGDFVLVVVVLMRTDCESEHPAGSRNNEVCTWAVPHQLIR